MPTKFDTKWKGKIKEVYKNVEMGIEDYETIRGDVGHQLYVKIPETDIKVCYHDLKGDLFCLGETSQDNSVARRIYTTLNIKLSEYGYVLDYRAVHIIRELLRRYYHEVVVGNK